jgi:hypothetical protein
MIPTFESKATPEEMQQKRAWLKEQLELISDQQRIRTPMENVKIRCGCNKLIGWQYMYRCLYCGIWYCKDCAEEHYGMKVPVPEVCDHCGYLGHVKQGDTCPVCNT